MLREPLPLDTTRRVTPQALTGYAQGLGWQALPNGKRSEIQVFHRPESRLDQIIIPVDISLADYGEAVAEAVHKLARHEQRPAQAILEQLLFSSADILSFREISIDADSGHLALEHASRLVHGVRRLLLSVAHSVLIPQVCHPRLSRSEAEEFLNRCRLGQTDRGSFVLNVACPLEARVAFPDAPNPIIPFARRSTTLLMESLVALANASQTGKTNDLLDLTRTPGMSANLCESLLLMRPGEDRACLSVSMAWSRAFPPPHGQQFNQKVELHQAAFDLAEALGFRLRMTPEPHRSRFLGFVNVLGGQPSHLDSRPCGEVDFSLFDEEQGLISARGLLNPTDYAIAAAAHLESGAVSFKATLRRFPRLSRLDDLTDFQRILFDNDRTLASS